MIKRMSKVTSLLVAAAAMTSLVPASAATRLSNKEGTIENAVAFKDGSYIYQGYRTDDDSEGIYFNSGDKDKQLDDVDTLGAKFDDKYVAAKEGSSDEYVVDLSNGKISDEDTLGDLKVTAETKLKTKLGKASRYDTRTVSNFEKVSNNQFGDMWYSYSSADETTFGYTNASGQYIDCSFDLNAYVYYAPTTKMFKVEDLDDKVKVDTTGTGNNKTDIKIKAKSMKYIGYLGQDQKYIYSVIEVTYDNGTDYTLPNEIGSKQDGYNNASATHYYVQKVSKAQGEKEEGAYKPKTTETFEIGQKTATTIADSLANNAKVNVTGAAVIDNSDVSDAAKLISDVLNNKADMRIVDGTMYVAYQDDEKVKVQKVVLKTSEKVGVCGSKASADKVSLRVAKVDGDEAKTKADDWTFDVNGNVWAIYNGDISKSTKADDFKTVYTCDRSLNALDVYDENNLIAWDTEGDVYTTVTEGSAQAKEDAEEIVGKDETTTTEDTTVTVKAGWNQAADGTWTFVDSTGAKVTGWYNDNGTWYYMNKTTAVMQTGWVNDNGTWYFMNTSGAMQTGWVNAGGTWYYMNASGAMQTGWIQDGSTWYYCNASGAMLANTTVNGYVLGANGAWIR